MQKGYLILENGQAFPGVHCGAEADTVGELVFTTGMTGYLETLTDPSYYGQIVMQTFPLIGNYGAILKARTRMYVRTLCATSAPTLPIFALRARFRNGSARKACPALRAWTPGSLRASCGNAA